MPAAARGAFRFLVRCVVTARVTRRGCVDVADSTKSGEDDIATRVQVVRFAVERIDVGVSASLTEATIFVGWLVKLGSLMNTKCCCYTRQKT